MYDSGNGQGVSNFVKGLYGMMPQLNDFLGQSGMGLPESLVNKKEDKNAKSNGHAPSKLDETTAEG